MTKRAMWRRISLKTIINEFKCKRQDYNYYIQVIIQSGEVYEVICRSIHSTADELAEWP